MSDPIRFDTRVAIVTGAGGGLGRAHALALAARGAKVVVNDVGNAQAVVDEIRAAGGEAMASAASVSDADAVQDMVARIMAQWGRIDILINNAGILRDKSFAKTPTEFFEAVIDVHLRGAWVCTQAVWEIMRAQGYGRVLMTTSSSGLYGNFGQANYSSAKLALVGLMNTLAIEGEKSGIRVNALAPAAMTQMTEALLPAGAAEALGPEKVSPAALFLVSEGAPTKTILTAGAGVFAVARIEETPGLALGDAPDVDDVAAAWEALQAQPIHKSVQAAWEQTQKFVDMAKGKG
ncbi:SDR family NAD(P)-dependent oxidoreductase [Pararhodobacter zhoushanensis]|uniref:SDR family NAD(P)-dependent oxidoreductase n=1 Tax=Pararhodobacter zhoushanensis TaxID=2479545 RepID=UPI0015F2AF8C|nr:SDR family NAD(P)-dependent oxidoreductase [Pararhodobacter zhoushanensis]